MLKNIYLSEDNRLTVIGDISCDPGGGIEVCTETFSDIPYYTYNPDKDISTSLRWDNEDDRKELFETTCVGNSVAGEGVVLMTITNLPCQLPKESSRKFSYLLRSYIPDIAKMYANGSFENLTGLVGRPIRRATMVYQGKVTEGFKYLNSLYSL